MTKITAAITGVGGYVPDFVLSNSLLEQMVDTTDEWITTRTGIKERRILKEEGNFRQCDSRYACGHLWCLLGYRNRRCQCLCY